MDGHSSHSPWLNHGYKIKCLQICSYIFSLKNNNNNNNNSSFGLVVLSRFTFYYDNIYFKSFFPSLFTFHLSCSCLTCLFFLYCIFQVISVWQTELCFDNSWGRKMMRSYTRNVQNYVLIILSNIHCMMVWFCVRNDCFMMIRVIH